MIKDKLTFSSILENVFILVQFTLYCPRTNAAVEMLFLAPTNDFGISDKSRLNVDAITIIKFNIILLQDNLLILIA